jgi:PAS domain S-box-containing protein
MVSYRKQIIFLIVSVLICIALIFSIFVQIRKGAVREMNERQMIYARLAAKGIESVLDHHVKTLQTLAQSNRIILMNEEGKALLRGEQHTSGKYIKGITRTNAQGKIIYTLPSVPDAIGANISGQNHVREILRTHKMVVSDIFESVQGFKTVAIHVPVFRDKTFDGTMAVLLSFDNLAKDYLDNLYIPNNRYTQLINARGKIIHCVTPDHLGRSILELYKDNTEATAMINSMMKGAAGTATFIEHDPMGSTKGAQRKYATYIPIRVGNSYWSVAVISSERLMLPWAKNIRKQIITLALILIAFFAITVYVMARIRGASVEAQARQKIEEDLIKSAQEVQDLYHNAPCGYHSLDAAGLIVRMNDMELSWLGYTREELIGKSFTLILSEASRDRFPGAFARLKESDVVRDAEYDMVRKDGTTFPVLVTSSMVTDEQGNYVMSRSMVLDITLRRRQEETLRESEALYRTALETTNDGISIIQDRKYVYVNRKLMETIGRPDESLIGKTAGIFVHPEDRKFLEENYIALAKNRQIPYMKYDIRVIKPDGSIAVTDITTVVISYKGRPAFLAFIVDVTGKKQTEEALRESEALYRTALETTSDGITIIQEGKYVYANQRVLETIDRKDTDILGLPVGCYMHPGDLERLQGYYEAYKKRERVPANYDMRVIKPDGSVITVNISAVGIIYKGKPAVLSFILDITARKKAEEALRQSEERYRTIIESIDDDYFETDLRGNITFLNKPYGWSGYSRETLIGISYNEYTTPEMSKKIKAVFNKVYREGTPARIVDHEITRQDGSIAHLEMSVSLMRNAEGKPIGFRGISRDVSERFRMEEESKRLTEQLHQAQKMEAIGTLAGGIAHDFNNLLMGIQGYTSLMLLEVDETHPYYEQLKAVQTLVQSGANLTRQLLGFARAGRYEVVPTNLNDLIGKSINLFGRTRKEIRIFEKYAEKIWTVEADRGQIEQVLLNMFVNAWQAMSGGGSLYLETENVTMDDPLAKIHDLKPGRYVKISITDTGSGMDEKTRQRIFDPFFTTKEMGRGTGLGLASAYGIIKGHGGLITVYSEKGQGTTFNIYLPASSKEVDAEENAESELSGGHETILLVDDEVVITEVTGRLLKELGYTTITAGNGEEAIAIYIQRHADIDLAIIDMIMPGMSGSETFDQLKAINPSVRVILSSGYSLNGKAQAIMDKGVRAFLQKPYRFHDLAQKIREALSD